MWQALYDELKDKGFMVVAVAEESRGADHARPWIEQAKSSYWQLIDVETFWKTLGGPVIASDGGAVWALGAPADERNAALEGLEAPDFTLPDVDGALRTLSHLRGKKVFLATWASW